MYCERERGRVAKTSGKADERGEQGDGVPTEREQLDGKTEKEPGCPETETQISRAAEMTEQSHATGKHEYNDGAVLDGENPEAKCGDRVSRKAGARSVPRHPWRGRAV